MLAIYVHLHAAALALASEVAARGRRRATDERGQTTAEYALVLLGAAAVALLIVAWATDTDLIGKLFDAVVEAVTGKVS
jgi:Flp pilus assembly pilin Flp